MIRAILRAARPWSFHVPPMRTIVLETDYDRPSAITIARGVEVLARGGLAAFAAETVYGLGADALNEHAVAAIFAAKGRPAANPLIVHVSGIEQARECASHWPTDAERLARAFWPGPLTLVLPRSSAIRDLVTAGGATVGLRAPASPVALALIRGLGRPIAAPSANRSNHVSPTRAEHVIADLDGMIDLVIDSGPTAIGLESTVVDLTLAPYRILRPGPITAQDIEAVLGGERVVDLAPEQSAGILKSPGQQAVHYAPRAPAYRAETPAELARALEIKGVVVAAIGRGSHELDQARSPCHVLETPEIAARSFYHLMRRCDALEPRAIIVVMPPDEPRWRAIRDRIERATRPLSEWDDGEIG